MNRSAHEAGFGADPLAGFDLGALLEAAARPRSDRAALSDPFDCFTYEEANRRAHALARRFGELSLAPGETILLAAGAPALTSIALIAALRAGAPVAVAPAWTDPILGGRLAERAGAAAIVVTPVEGLGAAEPWLQAAAAAASVRVVCTLGSEAVDGALRFDPNQLADGAEPLLPGAPLGELPISTFDAHGRPIAHSQRTLTAAALDLVARARLDGRRPIVSTILPTSFAGLLCGPIVSLVAGSRLFWRTPFDGREFLRQIDENAPVHLIAPAAMATALEQAGLLVGPALASLTLLSRGPDGGSAAATLQRSRVDKTPPVVDLYAFGENAVVPEPRDPDGAPVPPVREPHVLDFGGSRVVALERSSAPGGVGLHGAAVSA